MKKILSLLSMLMITVMAFATDYTDQLTFKLTVGSNSSEKSLPQGTLTIEKRVDGTYNVTASSCDFSAADFGNWGDISCDGVAGTTNADGLTTIEVSKPEVFANGSVPSEYSLSGQSLLVKFNGTKAYALLKGKLALNAIVGYPFEYTFGTDEGFDGGSTGGGETGGETSSIVTVKENFQSTEGSSWGENVTIDWTTQKLVVSVNLASTGSDKGFLGVTKKGQTAGWNNDGIIFYNTNGSTIQGYAPGQFNNANTDQVTKGEDPVRFEISKDGGVKCQGNVVISADNIAHLTNQSEIVVGAADKPAGAFYNYIKVVPLDWTEVPPVTVKDTKKFENVAYTTSMGGSGTATVTFTEMSDGTFPMTFVSDDLNVKAENLTKGTDEKGRTTYTGTAKRTDVDVTFTVKAVVYGETTAQKLYMTMDNGSSLVVTVGEDPDAPKVVATVPFTGVTLSASNGVTGTADVTFKEMSDNTVQMTFNGAGYGISATNLTKGTDTKGRTTYTGEAVNDAASTVTYTVNAVVYSEDATQKLYMTMVSVDGTTFTVGENPDAVTESSNKTYTSNLRIFDGEEPVVENAEAQVNIIKYSNESYKVTLKNVNMLNKTQDLVFVETGLVEEAPTEATEPLTIIAKSDEATTAFFGEEMNGTFEITEVSAEEIKMGFVLNNTSLEYQGEFNYTEEETPEVYTNNLHIYDAAAPETDLFQADQAKVEFLATATGEFKLTLKDVTLNEKKSDLVFTGTLPTPQPGGQEPLAEEGETTPAEPAMVLNATADEATATFLGTTSATAVFNVIMNDEAETENDAFALTFTITAGEKTLGGEFNYEKQDTPDEKYPVSFDKTALNTSAHGRMLNSFSLQQAGKEKQTKSVKTSKAAYEDHTADEPFTVEAGSELTASFDYTGEWMHSFVYIDFDNDGDFSYKEGQWDQTGTDLVAYSFYSLDSNPKNDTSGYNSVGDELTGDARNTYAAPSFKAPAKAGEYRIRFKFDWNCILPAGSSTILEDGGGVWDATLKVVEPVVDGISTINAEVANGETQLFTVNGVKLSKLQKGLNIVRTADGKVKKVLVK